LNEKKLQNRKNVSSSISKDTVPPESIVMFALRDDGMVWYTRPSDYKTYVAQTRHATTGHANSVPHLPPLYQTKVDFHHFLHDTQDTMLFDNSLCHLLTSHLIHAPGGLLVHYPPPSLFSTISSWLLPNSPVNHLNPTSCEVHNLKVSFRHIAKDVSVVDYPHMLTPTAFKAVVQRLELFENIYIKVNGATVRLCCSGTEQGLQCTR
jgi:hypothetical protein